MFICDLLNIRRKTNLCLTPAVSVFSYRFCPSSWLLGKDLISCPPAMTETLNLFQLSLCSHYLLYCRSFLFKGKLHPSSEQRGRPPRTPSGEAFKSMACWTPKNAQRAGLQEIWSHKNEKQCVQKDGIFKERHRENTFLQLIFPFDKYNNFFFVDYLQHKTG